MTFYPRGVSLQTRGTVLEFQLRNSPLRTHENSYVDRSRELPANSLFGISLVRLRDAMLARHITHCSRQNRYFNLLQALDE